MVAVNYKVDSHHLSGDNTLEYSERGTH